MTENFVYLCSNNTWHVNIFTVKALVDVINKFKNTNYTLEEVMAKYKELDIKTELPKSSFKETTKEMEFNGLRDLLAVFDLDNIDAENYWYEQYKIYDPEW